MDFGRGVIELNGHRSSVGPISSPRVDSVGHASVRPDNARLSLRTERGRRRPRRPGTTSSSASPPGRRSWWSVTSTAWSSPPTPRRCAWSRARAGCRPSTRRETTSIHETIDDEVLEGRTSPSAPPERRSTASRVHAEGELTLVGKTRPIVVRPRHQRRRGAQRQRRRQAERLGHEALLGAVRGAQGQGRGRGGVRGPSLSRGRRSARRGRPRRPAAEGPCRARRARCPRSS